MKRMMKMMAVSIVLSGVFSTTSVFALAGGAPELHGIPGKEFGEAVSTLAKSEPGDVAEHVAEGQEIMSNEGMPATHEMTGKEFGEAVSTLAKSEPGAVAAHIADAKGPEMMEEAKTGGVPAAHGLTGKEFGKAVSTLAKSGPCMVAQHVSE
ncbi:MAG: hypothetical protein K0M69_12950 [Youngiibacter sp.]|nr:hypothetical protein [Youngiibacter sp.]